MPGPTRQKKPIPGFQHPRQLFAEEKQMLGSHHRGYSEQMSRLERITIDPAICHGQPVVRGLRYTVQSLLELLSSGMTMEDVLADYRDLDRDDLLAALEFGALTAGGQRIVTLGNS